jgi:hypothetical protein
MQFKYSRKCPETLSATVSPACGRGRVIEKKVKIA